MLAEESLNLLSVFLASPGDLHEERKAAKAVVDQVNTSIAYPFGWHIQLLGWEDTLPGAARPQDIINREVDKCELFVGLLWRRWGEPPGSPDYTSGFHEEFERAKQRRQISNRPEIWLFFKEIDEEQLDDPGEQLKKVLAFRKLQQSKKRSVL